MVTVMRLRPPVQTRWLQGTWGLLLFLMTLAGCSTMRPSLEVASSPTPLTTPLTPGLQCVGRLMDRYAGRNKIALTVALWPEEKGIGPRGWRDEITADFTLMVAAALNEIHPGIIVSDAFFTPSSLEGAVQPDITVRANITSFDRLLFGESWRVDLSVLARRLPVEGPEGDFNKSRAVSHLGFDLLLFDYPSHLSEAFTNASVGINLRRSSWEGNVAIVARILGLGGGKAEKRIESMGMAVRMLAEAALITSLSRRYRLPYMRCLGEVGRDLLLERRITDYFGSQPLHVQALMIRYLLRGYGAPIAPEGPWDVTVEEQLAFVKKAYALEWPEGDREQVFLALYLHLPLEQSPVENAQAADQLTEPQRVKAIQRLLHQRGYLVGDIDGVLGAKTRQAIREFQAAQGEEPTGRITAQLYVHLQTQGLRAQ
jgi:hypothetical protein